MLGRTLKLDIKDFFLNYSVTLGLRKLSSSLFDLNQGGEKLRILDLQLGLHLKLLTIYLQDGCQTHGFTACSKLPGYCIS